MRWAGLNRSIMGRVWRQKQKARKDNEAETSEKTHDKRCLGTVDPVIDKTVAIVVFFVAGLGGRDNLAEAGRFTVFAGCESSATFTASESAGGAFIAGIGCDVVYDAIAVGVFAVTDFGCVGVARWIVVIAIAVVGKAVFVGVLEGTTGSRLAELALRTIGVAAFLADAIDANLTVGAIGSADALAQTVVTDVSQLCAGRVAFDTKHAASAKTSVTLRTC